MKALAGAFNQEKGPYSVKTNCKIDGLFYGTSLNLRVQPGCRVLNLLDQAGHVLEEEVVKVLLLHVLELEHGLAGGLGGHGDGAAEVSLCCVTEAATVCPTLTLASVPGQYELTRGCNNTS